MIFTEAEQNEAERRRLAMQAVLNANAEDVVALLAACDEKTWNTSQLQDDYTVVGFCAPFVVVVRKSDGIKGSLMFTHRPRLYFSFTPA
jgi:hypothetical protein